ncbi:putative L-serine dehydratase [Aspergillus novofumigatus IBT 16806]|uniref:Putative L-serine dehydratase n=1 Tax=Aspergillus novofumigatus (strain IBT 16806) TaxID=1392255 RepID=A0A2I1C5S6_ASPN1|nr:putative L-serine dehydratase [Aspergillus novofumigatus IBT 16806]PKX93020.1 putative L-serine dehydratase [Aspergillus novofumigatus IBT 16806]
MGSISPEEAKLSFKMPWVETPLVESACLSRAAGCRIFLKLENIQPSGSFKSRAMGNQILSHLVKPENAGRRVHFYASSGAMPAWLPSPLMVNKLRAAGASDVIQYGETFSEAGEYMREVIMKADGGDAGKDVVKIALHPFDNEPIWEGNSTIIDELAAQLPPVTTREEAIAYNGRALPLDAVICSVGGGGLLNGLIMGLERRRHLQKQSSHYSNGITSSQPDPIHILAVETQGTDSLAVAVAQKSLVSLPKITSQATSLGAIRVSERTFKYAISPPPGIAVHSAVLSDADAARGVLRLADDERLLVELACGVCVEAAIGDAAKARASGSASTHLTAEQAALTGKKRKRTQTEFSQRDEGYGDDRLSSGETETEAEETGSQPQAHPSENTPSPSPSHEFQSKLKQLVPNLQPDSRVVIIVCGGSNVTIDVAAEWRKMLQEGWGA